MADDSDNLAVLLHLVEVLINASLATFVLPALGGLGECLLLRAVPSGNGGKGEREMPETHQHTRRERSFRTATSAESKTESTMSLFQTETDIYTHTHTHTHTSSCRTSSCTLHSNVGQRRS